jgi:thiol-disulfide isomerase/thioredoxin
MQRFLFALPLLLVLASPVASADQPSLPGCEPPPALQKVIKEQLDSKEFYRLDYQQRQERGRLLRGKYPAAIALYRRWIWEGQIDRSYGLNPEGMAATQSQLHNREVVNPNDPVALDLYANALRGTDTPESIRMLKKAQSLVPDFVWPSVDLAQIYSEGKFADKSKFTEQLTKFWSACPTSRDLFARRMLVRIPELQAKVARAERESLRKGTDPARLEDYEFLWGVEFRSAPPQKFPELRQQIASDVKRLESIKNLHPDAAWAELLIQGSEQAGASRESIKAREDALIATYPHSNEAYYYVHQRWDRAHPEPNAKNVVGWKMYRAASIAITRQWIQNYPDRFTPPDYWRFLYLSDDDTLTERQGLAMAEAFLKAALQHYGGPTGEYLDQTAADIMLAHNWAPARALALLQRSQEMNHSAEEYYQKQDDHSEAELKDHQKAAADRNRILDGQLLLAAFRAHRPDAITPEMKASIEAPRAADDKDESTYWLRRARLAAIEGQQQDALGFYQLALRTRPKPPSYERGKLEDNLGDEAQALWTKLEGSDVAWAAWSQSATLADAAKADEARWEKPSKALPTFELADLSGKTWSVKSLNGKVVLINLWATWCGECIAELPQLQKLYEQTKGRSDLQILTFNIDEDLGFVEPFMKEKGYTFPVVPALSYVDNVLPQIGIPQSWVLDSKGQWEWTQVGYGPDDAWVKDMLAKLDAVKAGR